MMAGGGRRPGILFVVSAPSGSGKSTLLRRLVGEVEGLEFSVSFTTRPIREGERDGRAYHFVDEATFDAMVAGDDFLEWARVFDCRYGTGRRATEQALAAGRDLVLDIDVQGAEQVRRHGGGPVSIFLLPPDYPTLQARLRDRRSEDREQRKIRLSQARREAEQYTRYDYLVVNDDVDGAVEALKCIVEAERLRVRCRRADAERILATFPPHGEDP
jgi:guanylate kinase